MVLKRGSVLLIPFFVLYTLTHVIASDSVAISSQVQAREEIASSFLLAMTCFYEYCEANLISIPITNPFPCGYWHGYRAMRPPGTP